VHYYHGAVAVVDVVHANALHIIVLPFLVPFCVRLVFLPLQRMIVVALGYIIYNYFIFLDFCVFFLNVFLNEFFSFLFSSCHLFLVRMMAVLAI
jgi:hypothetical protein